MSSIPNLLRKHAESFKSLADAEVLVKEAAVKELVKAGMNEDVASGVVDAAKPSYMELWQSLMDKPNESYMKQPLAYFELLNKKAEYIEDLEAKLLQTPEREQIFTKLAESGLDAAEIETLKGLDAGMIEKIASLTSGSPLKELGRGEGQPTTELDPLYQFMIS